MKKEKERPRRERLKKEGRIACRFSRRCAGLVVKRTRFCGREAADLSLSLSLFCSVHPALATSFFRASLPFSQHPSVPLGSRASPFFFPSLLLSYNAFSSVSQHSVTAERSYGDPFAARAHFRPNGPSLSPFARASTMRLCKLNERDGRSFSSPPFLPPSPFFCLQKKKTDTSRAIRLGFE